MIIILTYKGTHVGRPMNDIKEEKLMDFIKTEMELGRTIHIVPEEKDLFPLVAGHPILTDFALEI